jgi:hypothetical protein
VDWAEGAGGSRRRDHRSLLLRGRPRVLARAAEVRAQLPALRNPFKRHPAVPLTPKQFHYTFANTLSQEESDESRDRYHVPCAVTVLRESAFAILHQDAPTKVAFTKDDRAPGDPQINLTRVEGQGS